MAVSTGKVDASCAEIGKQRETEINVMAVGTAVARGRVAARGRTGGRAGGPVGRRTCTGERAGKTRQAWERTGRRWQGRESAAGASRPGRFDLLADTLESSHKGRSRIWPSKSGFRALKVGFHLASERSLDTTRFAL